MPICPIHHWRNFTTMPGVAFSTGRYEVPARTVRQSLHSDEATPRARRNNGSDQNRSVDYKYQLSQ